MKECDTVMSVPDYAEGDLERGSNWMGGRIIILLFYMYL